MKCGEKNPFTNHQNLKRLDRILTRMRQAGISEEDIEFLGDFWQADALHVWKLIDESERKKLIVN
jgi:hypothetical protein